MTLKQLQAFYWTAHLGSISLAALKLNITQSTLSKRVAELELALNISLFTRTTQSIKITEAGSKVLILAEKILKIESEIYSSVTSNADINGNFKIGVSELIAITWLPKYISFLYENFENLTIDIEVDLSSRLFDKLLKGEVDFAIIPLKEEVGSKLEVKHIFSMNFLWATSKKLYSTNGKIKVDDILEKTHITHSKGSVLKGVYENWLFKNNLTPSRFLFCNNLSVISAMTIDNIGISLLPEILLKPLVDDDKITAHICDHELPELDYFFCWKKEDTRTSLNLLADYAKEIADTYKNEKLILEV